MTNKSEDEKNTSTYLMTAPIARDTQELDGFFFANNSVIIISATMKLPELRTSGTLM